MKLDAVHLCWHDLQLKPRSVDVERRRVRATMSTRDVDRYGEIVEPKAFTKSEARRAARGSILPLLWNHNHDVPMGHWEDVAVEQNGLVGTAVFDMSDDADKRLKQVADGTLDGFSVAFIPQEREWREVEIDGKKRRVPAYTDVDLIECSLVTVPANPEAIARSLSRSLCRLAGAPDGDHDAGQSAAMLSAAGELVERLVIPAIQKSLKADPGSDMHHFIRNVVQVMRGAGSQGDQGDDANAVLEQIRQARAGL